MISVISPAESEPTRRGHHPLLAIDGETALEDMVLGVDEQAVRDGINVLSFDDFDDYLAILVCRIGPNFYAHLSQVAGHYKGDASGIWDRSRGSGVP